jgi:chemotaxis protein MotA
MDLGTILGLVIGPIMVIFGILIGGSGMLIYINVPSVFITIGGSLAAILISNPLSRVLGIMQYFGHTLRVPNWEEERIIARLVAFSEKARREGLLALEDDLEEVEDEFL